MGFFSDLTGGAQADAAARDRVLYQQYQGQALPALQTGYETGTGAIGKAISGWDPLKALGSTYSSGAGTLMGALGIGTPDQVATARGAFSASPGYQFSMDQGMQALARARAAGNMTDSGNFATDAMKFGTGLADQEYQNWIKNLQTTGQLGVGATQSGAAGAAAGYGSLADLAHQYASDQTNVYGNVLGGMVNANQLQAQGASQGAQNILNAGLSLASLAMAPMTSGTSLLGMAGKGLGSMGSSLLSGGMQTFMPQSWQQGNPGAFGSSYYGPIAYGG